MTEQNILKILLSLFFIGPLWYIFYKKMTGYYKIKKPEELLFDIENTDPQIKAEIIELKNTYIFKKITGIYAEKPFRKALFDFKNQYKLSWKQIKSLLPYIAFNYDTLKISIHVPKLDKILYKIWGILFYVFTIFLIAIFIADRFSIIMKGSSLEKLLSTLFYFLIYITILAIPAYIIGKEIKAISLAEQLKNKKQQN